jgi:transcriptional regulator GlxA family with amidase domain
MLAAMSPKRLPLKIALFSFANAQALDLVGPHQILAAVNDELPKDEPGYLLEIVASKAGPCLMSSGLAVMANRSYGGGNWQGLDTLIVVGGEGTGAAMRDRQLVAAIRTAAKHARRIVSVCTGAFLLAEADLLKGKRATTHWGSCAQLQRRYPDTTVETDPIFVRDGNVWTSAGVTAGMDLALALVEEDFGHEMALKIARRHVLYMIRPGGQSQFSAQLAAQAQNAGRLANVISWIPDHLDEDLSVPSLASRAAMSERNFARNFRNETGETPARFIDRTRLEAARRLLTGSDLSVDAVAARCGFGSAERMRRSFQRQVRVSPNAYRQRFRSPGEDRPRPQT